MQPRAPGPAWPRSGPPSRVDAHVPESDLLIITIYILFFRSCSCLLAKVHSPLMILFHEKASGHQQIVAAVVTSTTSLIKTMNTMVLGSNLVLPDPGEKELDTKLGCLTNNFVSVSKG